MNGKDDKNNSNLELAPVDDLTFDAVGIVDKLTPDDGSKKPTTYYLRESIVQRFKDCCGEAKPSHVLEELMAWFCERHEAQLRKLNENK